MATDDALQALVETMGQHRRRLASSAFDIEDLIRAVDCLLEVQEMRLEVMIGRLIRARRRHARDLAGGARNRRRATTTH